MLLTIRNAAKPNHDVKKTRITQPTFSEPLAFDENAVNRTGRRMSNGKNIPTGVTLILTI